MSIWLLRNEFSFQRRSWPNIDMIWNKVVAIIRGWLVFCKDTHASVLDKNRLLLKKVRGGLLWIAQK
jgi:hypothetical protein